GCDRVGHQAAGGVSARPSGPAAKLSDAKPYRGARAQCRSAGFPAHVRLTGRAGPQPKNLSQGAFGQVALQPGDWPHCGWDTAIFLPDCRSHGRRDNGEITRSFESSRQPASVVAKFQYLCEYFWGIGHWQHTARARNQYMAVSQASIMQALENMRSDLNRDEVMLPCLDAYGCPKSTITRLRKGGAGRNAGAAGDIGLTQK